MVGFNLVIKEMETLSWGSNQRETIKFLTQTTRHMPLFMDVTPGSDYFTQTRLGFSQEQKHYLNKQ